MAKAILGLLLTVASVAAMAAGPLRAVEATQPRTYAVLIGIGDYPDRQIKARPHAEADARALYDLVTNKDYIGAAPEHVRLLLGSADERRGARAANRENILQALRWLAGKAGPDDLVIVAFIGQGGTIGGEAERLCYFAHDSTVKDRADNALMPADIEAALKGLKSRRFCALVDTSFRGFDDGKDPVPEPVLGALPFKEFRGTDGKPAPGSAPGRALFLASGGQVPAPNLKKHGLFTQVVLDGLKGGADRHGYEPDGVVTVAELADYLVREMPEQARKHGLAKADHEAKPAVIRGQASNFVLSRNPAAAAKARQRLARLAKLAEDKEIPAELAVEGRSLLSRMPQLQAKQELRKEYQQLADGNLTAADFRNKREELLPSLVLGRAQAQEFARKVMEAVDLVREKYLRDLNQGDLVRWAVEGLCARADEPVPPEAAARLKAVRNLSAAALTALLAEVRSGLGRREDLAKHKDFDLALQEMLGKLDSNSRYIDPVAAKEAQGRMQAQFTGVGINIRKDPVTDFVLVVTPIRGGPAHKAGVQAGDLIAAFTNLTDDDGTPLEKTEVTSTRGLTIAALIQKLMGKAKSRVKLTIHRPGRDKPLEIEIARGLVETETVLGLRRKADDSWDHFADAEKKIAYVRLSAFGASTDRNLGVLLAQLERQGLKGLVLDLRFNQGGLLNPVMAVADLLIDDGLIVSARSKSGKEQRVMGKHAGSHLDFPIVCLVNRATSSGAEIVAACLQDHQRAVLMGERTAGQAVIHTTFPFDGGFFNLLTASLWRPSGKSLDRSLTPGGQEDTWGVTPDKDFIVKLSSKELAALRAFHDRVMVLARPGAEPVPELRDRQLEMALSYLRKRSK
jgi:C-terminal peptidase prc